ncbi:MAG: ParB/RepB/Spo0J family partition protein [Clostridium sp.]|nr:ParB/RepB/Spo0J family partition protein [Clostridium sp.]MCM1444097.1 ParB/RepB/Spo0J family partition protein [Candidatus Amulumruptor caecigallinarius]
MNSNLIKIKIKDIDSFKNHPFLVNNDDSLRELTQSIKENGLLNPLIVRKKDNDKYEMISGHRRKLALELIGIEEADAYVKDLNDDEAIVYMVDSNIYREKILPSEKAFAYKMKMDAIKHQGKTTSDTEEPKLSSEKIGKQHGESASTVKKYIRLTKLIPELLDLVDNTIKYDKRTYLTMGIKPAVELSYLNKDEQNLVYASITYEDLTPSHAQAIKIRELSKNKLLNYNSLEKILSQNKGNQNEQISFNKDKIESVLPCELLKRDKRYIEQYIIEAIKSYNELNKEKMNDIDINNLKV